MNFIERQLGLPDKETAIEIVRQLSRHAAFSAQSEARIELMKTKARKLPRRLVFEQLEKRSLLATAILTPNADTFITTGSTAGSAPVLDLLDNGGNDRTAYVRFDLGQHNIQQITSARLTFHKVAGSRNDVANRSRFEVYGLTDQAGNTPQNWTEPSLNSTMVGMEYSSVNGNALALSRVFNLDQDSGANVVETITSVNGVEPMSLTGPDLVTFLNSRLNDGGLATFISLVDAGAIRGYGYASRENSNQALIPRLELTFNENTTPPQRQVEQLDRGLVVLRRASTQAYLGWRMFGDDPQNIGFNVYRAAGNATPVRLNATPITTSTNFVDTSANFTVNNRYFVRPVINGVEGPASESYQLPANSQISQRTSIPLQIPPPGVTPTGQSFSYTANDTSVGDVDGDGQYEFIVKWEPTNTGDVGADGYRGNVFIDAYKITGERLWRIDMGRNIRAGAHYTQFMVYDLDGDGRAEIAMRTAPGTIDGQGVPVLMGSDLVTMDFRNSSGVIITGPEYLTVFSGQTGAQLASVAYQPARVNTNQWGDDYGNRSERHLGAVAYLDGKRPSLVFGRGYYGPQSSSGQARNEIATYDYRDGVLSLRWHFRAGRNINNNINQEYIGQGAHSMTIGDVDGDGRDEIVYGASVIDDNGLGLYSTGLGHGDALHMSDMDPNRPGLEIFMVHESFAAHGGQSASYRDAGTGEIIFSIAGTGDVGRGVAADIDPNHLGFEMWALAGDRQIYNVNGNALYAPPTNMFNNFVVYWDGDLSRELLDGGTISEWNNPGRSNFDLDPATSGSQQFAPGASSNNGTKSTPALSADIFGDWREEVIWRRSDNSFLDIYSTIIATQTRLYTLMHDTQYRVAIAWQNSGYNQPPHPSFFIGDGMAPPPVPSLVYTESLSIQQTPLAKVYDGQNFSVVAVAGIQPGGLFDGRDLANFTYTFYSGPGLTGNVIAAPRNVGNYSVDVAYFASGSNVPEVRATFDFSVTPANLPVTGLTGVNRVYNATNTAIVSGTAFITPFAGDVVTLGGTPTFTFANKNVENGKPILASGFTLSGANASNYVIAQPSGLFANITPLALIGSITVANKVFDGTTAATILTRTLSGAFVGDSVDYTGGTATFDTAAVGNAKMVTATGLRLTGADAANYTVNTTSTTTADITQPASSIVNRRVFYNNATGSQLSSIGAANNAIASDKVALLPGESSTFANYTNYSRGLNGVIVDIHNLPATTTDNQILASLQFAHWNGISAAGFSALPSAAIPIATILAGSGIGGSSRIRIAFPDNTLQNTWLRVTVAANAATALVNDDVFYFGNVIGELNFGNSTTRLRVNGQDTNQILLNQSPSANSAPVTSIFDLNRDGRVNGLDTNVLLTNQQASGIVAPITVPPMLSAAFSAPLMAANEQGLAVAPLSSSNLANQFQSSRSANASRELAVWGVARERRAFFEVTNQIKNSHTPRLVSRTTLNALNDGRFTPKDLDFYFANL